MLSESQIAEIQRLHTGLGKLRDQRDELSRKRLRWEISNGEYGQKSLEIDREINARTERLMNLVIGKG